MQRNDTKKAEPFGTTGDSAKKHSVNDSNGNGGSKGKQRMMTLEEVEKQLSGSSLQETSAAASTASATGAGKNVMTLEEIEAEFVRPFKQDNEMSAEQQQFLAHVKDLEQRKLALFKLLDQKKALHDGLMRPEDQDYIAKIQLSQLANDPHLVDDFYNRRYQLKLAEGGNSDQMTISQLQGKSSKTGKNESDEEKYKKMMSAVKKRVKPRQDQLEIQGALGKIPLYNVMNPRQQIKITPSNQNLVTNVQSNAKNVISFKHVLKVIENVYQGLIEIDELFIEWQHRKQESGPAAEESQAQFNRKYTEQVKIIWACLHRLSPTFIQSENEDLKVLLQKQPPSLSLFLSVRKGRKCLPRLIRFLPPPQLIMLLKACMLSLKNIAIRSSNPKDILEELDEYTTDVVFAFVEMISGMTMDGLLDIVACLRTNEGDLTGVARSKPGLLFLTLIISRAELIKQQQNEESDATMMWNTQVFPYIFNAFETRFNTLFPPTHIMPSLFSQTDNVKPIPVDDSYAWQFLAAMAVASTLDQQRILVAEIRDKIFETVTNGGQQGVDKVNVFLNAIGLDASQLVA